MKNNIKQSGFTLIEIAIVLLIVGIILGYTVALLPVQREISQYREVDQEMERIIDSLIGFAQINGRLPCPDTSRGAGTIDGSSDDIDAWNTDFTPPVAAAGVDNRVDACESYFGFLPKVTLGLNGRADGSNVLLDPWGQRYRYAITDVNADVAGLGNAIIDFVTESDVRNEGLPAYIVGASPPDLVICDTRPAGGGNNLGCDNPIPLPIPPSQVFGNAIAVIVSTGKDFTTLSAIEQENLDGLHVAIPLDKVFIATARTDDYDDVVRWITPAEYFTRLIAAEQLP